MTIPVSPFTIYQAEPPHVPAAVFEDKEFSLEELAAAPIRTDRHLVVLHGWNSDNSAMYRWVTSLKIAGLTADRVLWNIRYTYNTQFPNAARAALAKLRDYEANGYQFRDVLLLGYSQGGLVARQMIADGLAVNKLATACTPHEGLMYGSALPGIDDGVASMRQGSVELKTLNSNPREAAQRARYLFAAVTYSHGTWSHDNDMVVDSWSARGDNLGTRIRRVTRPIKYSGGIGVPLADPHFAGMDPLVFPFIIEFLRDY